MSGFDRIERRLPEVMAELAPATVPDYFDDLLGQTRRTRQRPAWSSLERWLPMDVVARPAPFRVPALRTLFVLLLLGVLLAATLAVYVGTRPARVPEPFGPARNGVIVLSTAAGDIVAYDAGTDTTSQLISGSTWDVAPVFSPDGSRFIFVRERGGDGAYWVANADGSGAREIVPRPVDWFGWSPLGDRIVVTRLVDGSRETSIVNLADGTSAVLDVGLEIRHSLWRPGHEQILFSVQKGRDTVSFYLADTDGTNLEPLDGVAPDALEQMQLSPDGSKLVYSSWGTATGSQGRIHVYDLDSGIDTPVPTGPFESSELSPRFSPDGTQLVYERYSADPAYEDGYRLVIAPVDGSTTGRALGPIHGTGTNGADVEFSPDGRQLLVTYQEDGSTWLLDVDGTGERQLDTLATSGHSWQRLAP